MPTLSLITQDADSRGSGQGPGGKASLVTLCCAQQGDELADQVLRYRSQARPTRKPRSAGRRPAAPSPHQPCLDSPGDQVVHSAHSGLRNWQPQILSPQWLARLHNRLSDGAGLYKFCRVLALLPMGSVPVFCRGVARQAAVALGARTGRAPLALPRPRALRRARPSRHPSVLSRSGHLSCQPGAPRAASSPPSAP